MKPSECIVPIFAISEAGEVVQFLGSGSFVEETDLLLTADHVVRDWQGPFMIARWVDLDKRYSATIVHRDAAHDLALLRVDGFCCPTPIKVPQKGEEFHQNNFVMAYDYGTTITAGRQISVSPSTRIGNVTRILNLQAQYGAERSGHPYG